MGFRLHIDIPLGDNEEEAIRLSNGIIQDLKCGITVSEFKECQYRLAKDEDRQIRNYLIKDENGHVSTKKSKLF